MNARRESPMSTGNGSASISICGSSRILATQGVIVPDRYTMLAKYLVATSCWEGQ